MEWLSLIIIVILLLFIGFLAGLESAFVSANKLTIELNRKQGTASGKIWGNFADNPTRFIGTILISFNVMLVGYGILVGDLLSPIWEWIEPRIPNAATDYLNYIRLLVEVSIGSAIILFVEFSSRAFFRAKSSGIMQSVIISKTAALFYSLFSSTGSFFITLAEWILKYIFNVKLHNKKAVFNKMDLEHYLQQTRGVEEEDSSNLNKEIFENALSLSEVKLRECLIPRKEIISVEYNTPISAVRDKFIETKLSRLIIYDHSIDNIVGYIHHLDVFRGPIDIKSILHPIPTVPESMSATDLMNKLSRERRAIAWVVDEFGGTAGIVTMEDLLEEIFGDIQDEYDKDRAFIEKQIAPNEYIFSGRLELDYLSQKYGLLFPQNEKDTETLSGYIIERNGAIPHIKDRIITGNYEFDILNVDNTRIEAVKVKVLI